MASVRIERGHEEKAEKKGQLKTAGPVDSDSVKGTARLF